jgi:Cdc6-like AAA superfamily ATPase
MAITRIGPNQSINLASNVTGTLPAANGGSGRTAVTGNVLQVVSTSAADDLVTTSTSYVDINLSLNITPSATSSKIFLSYNGNNENNGSSGNKLSLQMLRDSTQIADATGIGSLGSENGIVTTASLSVLDSPSTTSQITYKMQGKSDDGTVMVFNVNNDLGTITAYEIAG